jgi:hypothetical protein
VPRRLWLQVYRPELAVRSPALGLTRHQLANDPGRLLLEAALGGRDVLVRSDILECGEAGHRLTEVKSTTKVKP